MSLAALSVRRPITVVMRILSLVLLGAICLGRLPVDLLPKISLPTVVVNVTWPNVAPEEIEAQVTRPIERAVSSVSNLYEVSSTTSEGTCSVRVQFTWGTDIANAAVEVLQQVERARRSFPDDPTLQSPVVFRLDPSQLPVLILGASGEADSIKLRTLLENQIAPILESADGVASVAVSGGEERAILVDVDPARMRAHNLSLEQILERLARENQNLPAGLAKEGDTEFTLRSLGWFTDVDDLLQMPVDGKVVLRDVATVRDLHPETRIYTRLNGQPAVAVIVSKQSDANTVAAAESVMERIEQVKALFPQIGFQVAYDQSQFIENSLDGLYHHALIGGVLAVLILLFFLRNLQSTLVVAMSIPISVVSTFTLLYLCGFTLNTMSLGGLALSVGLIVDDAVVVLENIFRHIERDGAAPAEAAVTGTNEIMAAVLSSTFTVMVVFLPLLLVEGRAGQMFFQFGLVVVFSLAVSLLDATTVVPMLASRMAPPDHHPKDTWLNRQFATWTVWLEALEDTYRRSLAWALHHQGRVLLVATAVTAASFALVPFVGVELMPPTDSGDFTVSVRLPVGTSLATTERTMLAVEKTLMDTPGVATVLTATGANLSIRGTSNNATSFVGSATVKMADDRERSTLDTITDLRKKLSGLPGARVQIQPYDLVSRLITGGNQDLEVYLYGQELGVLWEEAQKIQARLDGIRGLANLDTNWQEASPEIQFTVDRDKLVQLGLDFEDVADTLGTATKGSIPSYFQEGGFQYPIVVQFPEADRKTVPALLELPLRTPNGYVTLGQVADAKYSLGPNQITRLNRQRFIAVTGAAQGRPSGEVQRDIEAALQDLELPEGYFWEWGPGQKRQAEEFAGMGLAVVLAVCLIYMLLASQFDSLLHPITVLTSVPLASAGVILALFLTGRTFGLTAFVGLLMLVGIVVKNGILLVDYTNHLRSEGLSREEALLAAGPTRLRPILMTAGAAVLGMLPIATGLGAGSEIQAPMATAIVGGLTASTLLTLLVVPVVYTILDEAPARVRRWFR